MTIEPVIGIQKRDTTISEKEFPSFSIFSTAQMARDYFTRYGYQFIGFYDEEKTLIIVKDNNYDLSIMTGDYNRYEIVDYRIGKVVISSVPIASIAGKIFSRNSITGYSFTHTIEETEEGMRLVSKATSDILLEAESMTFIDFDKLLINNYGLESIFSISEKVAFPLIKKTERVYVGNEPEQFVDMRYGMFVSYQNTIQPILANSTDLFPIVKKYPYGEKKGTCFKLINLPLRYGIFYSNMDTSRTNWYPTMEDRDKILRELGLLAENVLEGKHVKVMKD